MKQDISVTVRKFRVPILNFSATDRTCIVYIDLISWKEADRCDPPLTRLLADEDIQELVKNMNMTETIT